MTRPTEQQVLDCDDEQQLSEWAATICMEWTERGVFNPFWSDSEGEYIIGKAHYKPCCNIDQSSALVFDFSCLMMCARDSNSLLINWPILRFFKHRHDIRLLKLITKAAIITKIKENKQ